MGGVIVDRLGQLRTLRDRIDAEIRTEEKARRAREKSRAAAQRAREKEERRREREARYGGVDPAAVRAWAKTAGYPVAARGKLPDAVVNAYLDDQAFERLQRMHP